MQAQGAQAGGAARNGGAQGCAITNTEAAAKPQLEPEENYWGVSRLPQCLSSQTEHRPSTGETGTTPVLPTPASTSSGASWCVGPAGTCPAWPPSLSLLSPALQPPLPLFVPAAGQRHHHRDLAPSSHHLTTAPARLPSPSCHHQMQGGCHLTLSTPSCQPVPLQPSGNPARAQCPQPPLTHAILLLDGQPGRHGHRATRAVPWGPGRCRATAGSSCHTPRVTCTLSL